MMRSLFSGVAGLKTHQTRMDVIGNNIANVNTVAYKSSSMVFSDLISQTTQKASGPNAATGTGGINARQIGLGVKTGAISINISGQGASQSTGNPFDIMINGDNFFVVSNGQSNFFTRDGSFYVDGAGNLAMSSNGYNVMGWQVDEETMSIKQDTVSALRIMSEANMTYPPEATSEAYVSGIIDRNDTDVTSTNGKTINLNFYDNLGYSYVARITFKQSTSKDNNIYSVELTKLMDASGNEITLTEEQKAKIFGNIGGSTQQTLTANWKFDSATYNWDGTNFQKNINGTLTTIFTANQLINVEGENFTGWKSGAFPDGEDKYTGDDIKTVEQALETLAGAYSCTVDEFKKLFVTVGTNNVSMGQLLANIGKTETVNGAKVNLPQLENADLATDGRDFYGATLTFNPNTGKFDNVTASNNGKSVTLNLEEVLGSNFSNINVDFSTTNMYDNKGTSTVGATSGSLAGLGTGRRLGDMIGVSVQNNGMIYASYDNGMTKLLGQIATASFPNASGLEKQGDNLYNSTLNSGQFDGIGVDVTANGGSMSTGQLEMSNVDLSSEFTEMITTQRGFQANSRIITVSDTLLEELTNLKR